MDYAELLGYLKDDLRRTKVLMNSGIHTTEAFELCKGVISVCEASTILNRDLIEIVAQAYEDMHYALKRLKN